MKIIEFPGTPKPFKKNEQEPILKEDVKVISMTPSNTDDTLNMISEAKSDENPYKSQIENMEYVYRTLKIIDIFDKIKALPITKESYEISLDVVKKYSTDDLFRWIEEGNDSDFSTKPSFYNAILVEINNRVDYESF